MNSLMHCGRLVASRPQQYDRHFAFRFDCTPKVMLAASDLQKHLVHVPDRKESIPLPTHTVGVDRSNLQAPPTNRLEGHVDAAFGQEFLNIPVAEA